MYFSEKNNTNIDDQFEKGKKNSKEKNGSKIDFSNKKLWFIIGGILLLGIIVTIIILIVNKKETYIELFGDRDLTITLGGDYIEPGYKAYDKKGNDITNQVEITSDVNTQKEGEYEISYSVENITETRYVKVVKSDVFIRLKGDLNMYLTVGEKYTEPGYNVYGETDLNDKVKVTGKVDTSKAGVYQLIYTVVTSNDITVTKIRTVTVLEKNNTK